MGKGRKEPIVPNGYDMIGMKNILPVLTEKFKMPSKNQFFCPKTGFYPVSKGIFKSMFFSFKIERVIC